jgi:hypothetical protein
MLWRMRRGKPAACCVPDRRDELAELGARQQALGDQVRSAAETHLVTAGRRRAHD